ncbi:hypothetical protein M3J17_29690, partial [Klebsiella quasipneumoniae]|nr:hypothetical protein [Klebsiella quasipneumoniae]
TELAQRLKLEVHRAVSNFNPQMNIKTRDLKELVEALEKAQAKATQQGNIACVLLDEVTQLRRHADEKAPELRAQLIEADSELEALRQRIAELESRTVKMPHRNLGHPKLFLLCPFPYYDAEDMEKALAAAGIRVEAE